MQCPLKTKENTEILLDYCSGKLKPAIAAKLESHLETCPDCRAVSIAQRSAWDALDVWEPMPIPVDFDRKLYARIEQYEESGWWSKLWQSVAWRPVATACVTLAVGAMLYVPVSTHFADPAAPQMKMESSDLDQIETTLEDIEMFKQLTPTSART